MGAFRERALCGNDGNSCPIFLTTIPFPVSPSLSLPHMMPAPVAQCAADGCLMHAGHAVPR